VKASYVIQVSLSVRQQNLHRVRFQLHNAKTVGLIERNQTIERQVQ
jgi:hypothetical protein